MPRKQSLKVADMTPEQRAAYDKKKADRCKVRMAERRAAGIPARDRCGPEEATRRRIERDRNRKRNAVVKPRTEQRECKQTPNPRGFFSATRPNLPDCGIGPTWDRPRVPVAPLLVAPPFVPTVGANVVYSGPVVEKRVGDWRKGIF